MQELRKNREIQLNQQTIRCQVLADMIKIWSCLIFIKLYMRTKMAICSSTETSTKDYCIGNKKMLWRQIRHKCTLRAKLTQKKSSDKTAIMSQESREHTLYRCTTNRTFDNTHWNATTARFKVHIFWEGHKNMTNSSNFFWRY